MGFIPNLINWWILEFVLGILSQFDFIFVILGMPSFSYDTATGLGLFPEEVTSWEKCFNC